MAQLLRSRGQIEDVRYPYLAELLEQAATSASVGHHAGIVREMALLRALARVGHQIAHDAEQALGPARELLSAAEQQVFALAQMGVRGSAKPISDAVQRTRIRLDARFARGQGAGLQTNLLDLDRLTGGLQPGELILVASRPSVGKTSLLLALVRNVVEQGLAVFLASLEQSDVELVERLACMVGEVDSYSLRCGRPSDDELLRVEEALTEIERFPVIIEDAPGQTVAQIAANARRLRQHHSIGLVAVDYLQLVEAESRQEKRYEQVGAISRHLKHLARELGVPVVALAQLNREVENRKGEEPRLSDLRDSGELEQNADTVLLLHRPADEEKVLDILIAKQRNGPTGPLRLTFEPQYYRFSNHAPGVPT